HAEGTFRADSLRPGVDRVLGAPRASPLSVVVSLPVRSGNRTRREESRIDITRPLQGRVPRLAAPVTGTGRDPSGGPFSACHLVHLSSRSAIILSSLLVGLRRLHTMVFFLLALVLTVFGVVLTRTPTPACMTSRCITSNGKTGPVSAPRPLRR